MARERIDRGAFHIMQDDLSGAAVSDLLRQHLEEMNQYSPPEMVHAMPVERLREADVSFYSAWFEGELAAVGALKQIDQASGEIKSMRASDAARGRGAGEAILLHLIDEARRRGYQWLGLETGNTGPFLPAQQLYRKHGFAECEPFGDYMANGFSICLSRKLG